MEPNALAVVATRQFWVWNKAYDPTNAFPADTVLHGADFTGYTKLGYTSGGLSMNWNLQRGSIPVDQELDPVLRPVSARNLTLDSSLAEFTPANMKLATGQGTITSVAAGVARGHEDFDLNSNISDVYATVMYDIEQQNGEALRIAVWRGLPTGSPTTRFDAANAALIAYQVSALPDTSTTPARLASVRLVTPIVP